MIRGFEALWFVAVLGALGSTYLFAYGNGYAAGARMATETCVNVLSAPVSWR